MSQIGTMVPAYVVIYNHFHICNCIGYNSMYQFYYHRYGQWNHFFKDLPYIRSKQVCYHHKQHMTVPALVHRFLIPHIPSTRYLHHCRVVVSQRCRRIASFLRLALIQISSILYTKIKKTVY